MCFRGAKTQTMHQNHPTPPQNGAIGFPRFNWRKLFAEEQTKLTQGSQTLVHCTPVQCFCRTGDGAIEVNAIRSGAEIEGWTSEEEPQAHSAGGSCGGNRSGNFCCFFGNGNTLIHTIAGVSVILRKINTQSICHA